MMAASRQPSGGRLAAGVSADGAAAQTRRELGPGAVGSGSGSLGGTGLRYGSGAGEERSDPLPDATRSGHMMGRHSGHEEREEGSEAFDFVDERD